MREPGIRMALGAGASDVVRAVFQGGLPPVALGIVLGLGATLGLTRWLADLLYGVPPHDAVVLAAAAVLLLGTALVANWLPARRAARIKPTTLLRTE